MTFLADVHLDLGGFRLEAHVAVEGKVIGIFGDSGAGKTTLLEIVTGLRQGATGRISVDGRVLMDSAGNSFLRPEQRGIGYVPQDLALFPHLSVRQNLVYGHRGTVAATGLTLAHVSEVFEIDSLLDRSISQLSGGQKQRVAFARALLASPQLLLLDEPLASLEQGLKRAILPYLKRIRDEFQIPMLYVSHAPEEVAELCDQVVLIRNGRCLPAQMPREVFEASSSMVLKRGVYGAGETLP